MAPVSDKIAAFLWSVVEYHDIRPEDTGVKISNNNFQTHSCRTRATRTTSSGENKVLVAVHILEGLLVAVGLAQHLPSLLRPLNHGRHIEALTTTQRFEEDTTVQKTPFIQEVITRHKQIINEDCAKSHKILASAVVFACAAVARLALKPNSRLSPEKMNGVIVASLAFGALSHCYHALRSPALHHFHKKILTESGLQ